VTTGDTPDARESRLRFVVPVKPAVVISLVLTLVAAACGGGSSASPTTVATGESGSTVAATESQAQAARSPEDCLSQAGLSKVEQRDANLWRGFNSDPFFGVIVQSLGTSAKAKKAAHQADLVHAYAAGRYLVTGPVKSADDQGITQAVADCLA
jgi:hypothetical protein